MLFCYFDEQKNKYKVRIGFCLIDMQMWLYVHNISLYEGHNRMKIDNKYHRLRTLDAIILLYERGISANPTRTLKRRANWKYTLKNTDNLNNYTEKDTALSSNLHNYRFPRVEFAIQSESIFLLWLFVIR